MNKERIAEMIDRNIVTKLSEGHAIPIVKDELSQKMNKFASNVKESDKNIDLYKLLISDPNTITPTKTRYQIIYINHCAQRIKDLDWVSKNKINYPLLSRSQVFKLLKLKEKLSVENALPF